MSSLPTNPSASFKRRNPELYTAKQWNAMQGVGEYSFASNQNENHPDSILSNPKPESDQATALDSAIQRKTESVRRTLIRFTGFRVRPLDPDNFAGSVKDLLDGLTRSGLIHGDEPWRIILETEQVKVKSFAQEKTVIEITKP